MVKLPNITKEISEDEVISTLKQNFKKIIPSWFNFQLIWFNNSYSRTNDHDKWLILIYLVNKVLNFYSRNFVKLDINEFEKIQNLEVDKINIIEISNHLRISKETTRRKLIELEKDGFLKKEKKKIIINRSKITTFAFKDTLSELSTFCKIFLKIFYNKKILKKKLTSKQFEGYFLNNITYYLKLFYEMQIAIILSYKTLFDDLEEFHVFGVCAINKSFGLKRINSGDARIEYLKEFISNKITTTGISAMSISEISGIPRATVIRKLTKLIKKKTFIYR